VFHVFSAICRLSHFTRENQHAEFNIWRSAYLFNDVYRKHVQNMPATCERSCKTCSFHIGMVTCEGQKGEVRDSSIGILYYWSFNSVKKRIIDDVYASASLSANLKDSPLPIVDKLFPSRSLPGIIFLGLSQWNGFGRLTEDTETGVHGCSLFL